MRYHPEPIFESIAEHGEGPVWHAQKQYLYWVDLFKGTFFRASITDLSVEQFTIGQPLGVLALREHGGLVMAAEHDFNFFDIQDTKLTPISSNLGNGKIPTRFNDGAVDPRGRFFAGTMSWDGTADVGKLYRLDPDQTVTLLEEKLYIPNGMGWSPEGNIFYLTDTHKHVIYAYDYELTTGDISNRRVHIRFEDTEFPDGMTLDTEGHFWISFWGGSKIGRFDSSGKHVEDIGLPVPHPTSCCFGGADMKSLFVTTSQLPLSEDEKKRFPLAGRTFQIQTDTLGRHEPHFAG